jgi:pyruvate dehydrogenase E2 component (dihydrolipoamide acetyltransferase)
MSHETALFEFRFPDIGEGLTEGTIVELKVAPGSSVKPGQALAIVETDKVVTEMPSPVEGVVVELPITKGQVVQVGEIVAKIRTGLHPAPIVESAPDGGTVVGQLTVASHGVMPASSEGVSPPKRAARNGTDIPTAAEKERADEPRQGKVRASPVARKLAADAGIDLAHVNGTGPGGRILKKDLEARAAASPYSADSVTPALEPTDTGVSSGMKKLSTLRLAIAKAMEKSQAIPAAAVHDYTVVDELLQLRRDMNAAAREKVGLLAFFVKAAAIALRDFPLLSSLYAPERREYETFPLPNIGVAVDTDEGLVVPVVRDPTGLSVPRIHSEIARLTGKARSRTLALEEIRGGSFTISNFGSFSGVYGNPMILPPQVGILGIGRVHEEPVVREGKVVPASLLPLSLVVDHRLIDGVYACKFLARFMELVSKPLGLLML